VLELFFVIAAAVFVGIVAAGSQTFRRLVSLFVMWIGMTVFMGLVLYMFGLHS
jgi:hypothetical protein